MNHPAPNFWMRRKCRSMIPHLRIIVIRILTFGVVFHGVLYAQENPLLEFTDNDSRGGVLKGDLIFTVPRTTSSNQISKKIKDYVLHWGNNPHQRLGMFRPIVTLPVAKPGSRMRLQFKDTPVPQSATHLLLYSRNEFGKETEVYSLRLIDKGVPENKAQGIVFEQTGKEGNRVQGKIRITRAWDERDVTHYAVYWGEGSDTVLRTQPAVALIEKRSWFASLGVQFMAPWRVSPLTKKIDILLPPEATHFIVFTRNSEGQMSEGKSMKLQRMQKEEKAEKLKIILQKNRSATGFINGNFRLVRSKFEDDFSHYLFFWGNDELTRLRDYPPFAQIEVKKFRDGLTDKEIQVSTISQMDQEIEIKTEGKSRPELRYEFPENTIIPSDATHILVYTQKKFWFQDDAERRLKGPIANVSIMDPEGTKKKEKVLGNIKEGLENFSLLKYKKQDVISEDKTGNLESDRKVGGEKGKKFRKGSDWRISEYRGLGLGISLAGLNGIVTFYDYNMDYDLQLHYSLELTGPQVNSAFKALRLTEESTEMQSIAASGSGNTLEINRSLFSATLRWFVDESVIWGISDGFYYGAGGGLGYATLKYYGKDTAAVATISGEKETYDSFKTEYNHSTIGYGLFAVLDAGWQGYENYYIQFSLQPSFYIVYQDGYEETSIPENPNQRSAVTDRWIRAKDLTRVLIGFGIYF